MNSVDVLVKLGQVTAEQWGLVTQEQADRVGVDRSTLLSLARTDLLSQAGDGVWRLSGAPLPTHLDIKIAWLRLEPAVFAWQRLAGRSGVVSHGSACRLHGLGDLPSGKADLSIAAEAEGVHVAGARIHRWPGRDLTQVTLVEGLPVTTVERTIADLLGAGVDGGHVGGVVADAVQRGLLELPALVTVVAPYAEAYGLPTSTSAQDFLGHLLTSAHPEVASDSG